MPSKKKRGASTRAVEPPLSEPVAEPETSDIAAPKQEECQPLPEPRHCRVCDCTDERACPEGCSWVAIEVTATDGLCTACHDGLDGAELARFAARRAEVVAIAPDTPERFRAERDLDLAIEEAKDARRAVPAEASPAPPEADAPAATEPEPESAAEPAPDPVDVDAEKTTAATRGPARPKRKRPSRAKAKAAAAAPTPDTPAAAPAEPPTGLAYGETDAGTTEPYTWEGSTKVLVLRILPNPAGEPAQVIISARTHLDPPVVRHLALSDLEPLPAPIRAALDEVRAGQPAIAAAKLEAARAAEVVRLAEKAKRDAANAKAREQADRAAAAKKLEKKEKAEKPVLNKQLRDELAKAREATKQAKAAAAAAAKERKAAERERAAAEKERAKLAAQLPAPGDQAPPPAPAAKPERAPRAAAPTSTTEQFGLFGLE